MSKYVTISPNEAADAGSSSRPTRIAPIVAMRTGQMALSE
jgi:hypothetical protein